MFEHLRTKLTVLYVALFVAALATLSLAVSVATTQNARRVIGDQLVASGAVFDNLSTSRNARLTDEADILAHDFGFRAAVGLGEQATIKSALENIAGRFPIDLAYVVTADGKVIAREDQARLALPPAIVEALRTDDAASGVFALNGVAYEVVAASIHTPVPAGWVVFANALGPDALSSLTKLSAVPLTAKVVQRRPDGRWAAIGARVPAPIDAHLQGAIAGAFTERLHRPIAEGGAAGGALLMVQPLPAVGRSPPLALILSCSVADALRPFGALAITILGIAALMIGVLVLGSWFLARTLTGPISALEQAARSLQGGGTARVTIRTHDEIGRLGLSFNAMADDIEQRTASLRQAKQIAESANEAKSVFLANMNHELRTPLNGVLGVAGVLATTPLTSDQRQMVELIESSGSTLNRILNDVLDTVDLGADRLSLVQQPFKLQSLIADLADATLPLAAAKGLAFNTDLGLDPDAWVEGDERRLRQVLWNILDNAVKFTDAGSIQFSVHMTASGQLRCAVKDTGIGFDQGRVEQLFAPFSQEDGSMTRRAGGTGLGLGLARDLARALGGELTGQGAVGEGSIFTLTLPLKMIEAAPPAACAAAASETEAEGDAPEQPPLRILLAEDNPANRKVIEIMLSAVDVDLTAVENGAEAVEACGTQAFDVILMDLQMPVMDGLTAIQRIRQRETEANGPRTPILVISANVQSTHLKASAAAGADGHLAKPIQAPVLFAALEDALSGQPTKDEVAAV